MKYFSQPSGHSSTRFILLASLAAILLTACGQKAADVSGGGTVATRDSGGKSSPASGAGQNPCSLLEPREVEAVLGGTLVGPPYRFDKTGKQGPAADGDACRYETAAYHFVEIEVEWTGGARMMKMYGTVQNLVDQKMKGMLKLGDGSELTGEWDEAKVVNCCTFIAMRGDQVVTVDIAGSHATLEQAARIADAALKRISWRWRSASSDETNARCGRGRVLGRRFLVALRLLEETASSVGELLLGQVPRPPDGRQPPGHPALQRHARLARHRL